MQSILSVTASDGQPQPVGNSTAASIQQTSVSTPAAVNAQDQATSPDNSQVMNFLSSEAAGTVHDSSSSAPVQHNKVALGGIILATTVLLVGLLLFYKRLIHRKLGKTAK